MKNKEFHKLLKKNKLNSNSGFTLTELLVGLFMSIFVIGALGFGLMQVLRLTQEGNSETLVRNDLSRASEFISDEMRRAQSVIVDTSIGNINTNDNAATPDVDETIAPGYSLPTGGTARLALRIPNVTQAVVYSVAPPEAGSPWKGPLVIYRWGPNFDANGNYTDDGDVTNWDNQALVDGVSDANQTASCDYNADGDTDDAGETVTYQGFFACIVDNDGDGIAEDATDDDGDGLITFADDPADNNNDGIINNGDDLSITTFSDSTWDKNGDDIINNEDAADVDGLAITAQLYFTGETKLADGISTDTYSADTKAVARARTAPENNSSNFGGYITSFRTLDPSFSCNTTTDWSMRTDFGSSLSNPSDIDTWDHQQDRQPQPITISGDSLVISSIPRGVGSGTDCLNERTGNGHGSDAPQDFAGNKTLGESDDWHTDDNNDIVAISHKIDFNDPRTFNGNPTGCSGSSCHSTNGRVLSEGTPNQYVIMLKKGSPVPAYNGYDMNNDGDTTDPGEQISLGEFLESKGLATGDLTNGFVISNELGDDERIIAFEVGKSNVSDLTVPGVDFQDNIFILQSDAFSQDYSTFTDDSGTTQAYSSGIN